MPLVATKAPYTLFVMDDDMAENPRENGDNFGKMVCWNRRHSLGDEHDFDDPQDFLNDMLFDLYSSNPAVEYGQPVYDYIRKGNAENVRLQYNRSTREWELLEKNYWLSDNTWTASSSYPASLKGKEVPDTFLYDCLSALSFSERIHLLEQSGQFAILPLYLYDHSGITMSTGSFSCPWDSGQVGWIYADAEMIEKEYGKVTPETLGKAKEVLEAEVLTYDYYLTGQCYGFQLFEGEEEIDSCWGFLGDIRSVQDDIKEYIPKGFEDMVENLQYRSDRIYIEDYLHEMEDTEDLENAG